MIHDPQHTLTHVSVEAPATLRLVFADGMTFSLDLATTLQTHTALAALADPEVFSKARLDARGGYVVWSDDDLEMAADNLRHLAVEQAGGIGHERLVEWIYRHRLTQAQAAEAIGISRRMLNYYLSGARPIPKTVWLACLGWESQQAA
jgi:hypothetical protein